MFPVEESRGSKKSDWPSQAARGRSATAFVGSSGGDGNGASVRIVANSSLVKLTMSGTGTSFPLELRAIEEVELRRAIMTGSKLIRRTPIANPRRASGRAINWIRRCGVIGFISVRESCRFGRLCSPAEGPPWEGRCRGRVTSTRPWSEPVRGARQPSRQTGTPSARAYGRASPPPDNGRE